MRVTNQQILNQMSSDLKKLDSKSQMQFEKGDVFKAVIREVMSDSLLLELKSGVLLRSNLPQGGAFAQGSEQSFEVLESGKQLLVRPYTGEPDANLEKTLQDLFKGTGEKVTPERLSAAKALQSFGQPISRQAVNDLLTASKQVDTLKGLVESNLLKLSDIPPKSPIKQILVSFYSKSTEPQPENEAALVRLLSGSEKYLSQGEKTFLISENSDNEMSLTSKSGLNGDQLIETSDKKNALVSESALKNSELDESLSKNGNSAQAQAKEATAKNLLDLLKNVDFQKLAFHKSNQMNSSIQNLAMLDKLIFGKDTVAQQVESLVNILKETPEKVPQSILNMLSDLQGLGLNDEDETEEALRNIIRSLDASEGKNDKGLNQVKSQLTNIQQSIDYMKGINDNLSYFQLPIQVDNELRSVDFFVKKKKSSKKTGEETIIFISLDTHTLNTVQVLLEYKNENVKIQFRLSDQEVLEKMEMGQAVLEEQLNSQTDVTYSIKFRLKESALSNLDIAEELSLTSAGNIDMKV
ncbi:hypothetical protein [Fusibacter sp. JL216-2]|uniref:hypothetical protein n=1 Tax=Fusibacter sp. JL216-2 TaxID=3071453 RepID=UPI003D346D82